MAENWKSKNWDAMISGELCPVCDLIRNDAPEDDHNIAVCDLPFSRLFLAKNQFVRGYCVLICHKHVIEPYELTREERAAFFDDLASAGKALLAAFGADKMNYNILGNVIPHLHAHLLPRYFTDSAPNRPIDPGLKGHEVYLSEGAYAERIELIRQAILSTRSKRVQPSRGIEQVRSSPIAIASYQADVGKVYGGDRRSERYAYWDGMASRANISRA